MTKEVTICDVCNKEIVGKGYVVRYYNDNSLCWREVDVCKECLSKGLIYDKCISRLKIADADDNVTGIPGERQAY